MWPACPSKENRVWLCFGGADTPGCGLLHWGAGGRKESRPRMLCVNWHFIPEILKSPSHLLPPNDHRQKPSFPTEDSVPLLCDRHWLFGNSLCISLNSVSKETYHSYGTVKGRCRAMRRQYAFISVFKMYFIEACIYSQAISKAVSILNCDFGQVSRLLWA